MTTDLNAQVALNAMQTGQAGTLGAAAGNDRAQKAAQDFEGVFLGQMLSQMFEGVETDGPFGGGFGEEVFRSMMVGEFGKEIAASGGIGVGNAVLKELIALQETRQ